jgi:hypothetical protein
MKKLSLSTSTQLAALAFIKAADIAVQVILKYKM